MAGRSYDLNKTWVPGHARGTTVFNSSGNITIPYGRNKITVSGVATPGNPSFGGSTATYNGTAPATYSAPTGGNEKTYTAGYSNPILGYNEPYCSVYATPNNPSTGPYNSPSCDTGYNGSSGGNPAPPFYNNCGAPYGGGDCAYQNNPTTYSYCAVYAGGNSYCTVNAGGDCINNPTTFQGPFCQNFGGGNYSCPAYAYDCTATFALIPGYNNGNYTVYGTCDGTTYNSPEAIPGAYTPNNTTCWSGAIIGPSIAATLTGEVGEGPCPNEFYSYLPEYGTTVLFYYICVPCGGDQQYTPGTCLNYNSPTYPPLPYNSPSGGNCSTYTTICPPGYVQNAYFCAAYSYNVTYAYCSGTYSPVNCTAYATNPTSCQSTVYQTVYGTCVNFYPYNCTTAGPFNNTYFAIDPGGNCTSPLTPGYNNFTAYGVPGGCTSPVPGTPYSNPPNSPGPPVNAYYAIVYGTELTYNAGGNPATYNPFVSGNPGASTTVLGVYFPGGNADNPAPYVSGVSNYWQYPDGETYPVSVTPGGQITVKIE